MNPYWMIENRVPVTSWWGGLQFTTDPQEAIHFLTEALAVKFAPYAGSHLIGAEVDVLFITEHDDASTSTEPTPEDYLKWDAETYGTKEFSFARRAAPLGSIEMACGFYGGWMAAQRKGVSK